MSKPYPNNLEFIYFLSHDVFQDGKFKNGEADLDEFIEFLQSLKVKKCKSYCTGAPDGPPYDKIRIKLEQGSDYDEANLIVEAWQIETEEAKEQRIKQHYEFEKELKRKQNAEYQKRKKDHAKYIEKEAKRLGLIAK